MKNVKISESNFFFFYVHFILFFFNLFLLICGSDGKASAYNAEDPGLIPGSGRSSGEGNSNSLQYSCLENPMEEEPGGLQSMGSRRVRHD